MNLETSYTLEYLKDLYKIGGKLDNQFKNIFSLLNGDEKLISDAFFDLFYRLDFDEEKKVFKKARYSLNPTSYFELEKINSHLKSKHPANTALPSDPISLNLVPT